MAARAKSLEIWKQQAPFYVVGQRVPMTHRDRYKPMQFEIAKKADELKIIFDFSTSSLTDAGHICKTIAYLKKHFDVPLDNVYLVYSAETQPLHLRGYRDIIAKVLFELPDLHVRAIAGSIKTKAHYDFQSFVEVTEDQKTLVAKIKATEALVKDVLAKEVKEMNEIYVRFLKIIEDHSEGIEPLFNKILDNSAASPLTKRSDKLEKLVDTMVAESDPYKRASKRQKVIATFLKEEGEYLHSFLLKISEYMPFSDQAQTLDDIQVLLRPYGEGQTDVPDPVIDIYRSFLGYYRNGEYHPPVFMEKLEEIQKGTAVLSKRIDFVTEVMGTIIRILEYLYLQMYCMQSIMDLFREGSSRARLHNPFTFSAVDRKRFNGILAAFSGQSVFFKIKKYLYEHGLVLK